MMRGLLGMSFQPWEAYRGGDAKEALLSYASNSLNALVCFETQVLWLKFTENESSWEAPELRWGLVLDIVLDNTPRYTQDNTQIIFFLSLKHSRKKCLYGTFITIRGKAFAKVLKSLWHLTNHPDLSSFISKIVNWVLLSLQPQQYASAHLTLRNNRGTSGRAMPVGACLMFRSSLCRARSMPACSSIHCTKRLHHCSEHGCQRPHQMAQRKGCISKVESSRSNKLDQFLCF